MQGHVGAISTSRWARGRVHLGPYSDAPSSFSYVSITTFYLSNPSHHIQLPCLWHDKPDLIRGRRPQQ
ncbi:hypothetical protein AMECASPLE_028268 [Ameca splendens]|uniref:Uncharacterized protein n=1 Tax=Ameca splendens TaxID=208324 RepID=A0ABV1A1N2_9TELE